MKTNVYQGQMHFTPLHIVINALTLRASGAVVIFLPHANNGLHPLYEARSSLVLMMVGQVFTSILSIHIYVGQILFKLGATRRYLPLEANVAPCMAIIFFSLQLDEGVEELSFPIIIMVIFTFIPTIIDATTIITIITVTILIVAVTVTVTLVPIVSITVPVIFITMVNITVFDTFKVHEHS